MSLRLIRRFGIVQLIGSASSGLRRFGVPPGGAFDSESFSLANGVVGAGSETANWELSQAQATFQTEMDGCVGVAGAACSVVLGSERLSTGCGFSIRSGEEFTVEAPRDGARVYISFISAYCEGWRLRLDEAPSSVLSRNILRVTPGPQAHLFDLSVLSTGFTVSRIGNRVGVRLEESVGGHKIELPSEPSCVGAVQISNDGTPIILGPDGPTIGGYPKIAVVASCDIDRVGQLAPGDSVRFQFVGIEEARALAAKAKASLDRRLTLLGLARSVR